MSARSRLRLSLVPMVLVGMMLVVGAVAAEEPLKLDLDIFAAAGLGEATSDEERFRLNLRERFVWDAEYSQALLQAIWDSPLGRAEYEMAMAQRGLGMSGLVHAGSSFPIYGRYAGRSTMTPTFVVSTNHRVQIGVETAIAAGALWALVEGINH